MKKRISPKKNKERKKIEKSIWLMRIDKKRLRYLEFMTKITGYSQSFIVQTAFDLFCDQFYDHLTWWECMYAINLIDKKFNKRIQKKSSAVEKRPVKINAYDLSEGFFRRKKHTISKDRDSIPQSHDPDRTFWNNVLKLSVTHKQKAIRLGKNKVKNDIINIFAFILPNQDHEWNQNTSIEEVYRKGFIDEKGYRMLKENPCAFSLFFSVLKHTRKQELDDVQNCPQSHIEKIQADNLKNILKDNKKEKI